MYRAELYFLLFPQVLFTSPLGIGIDFNILSSDIVFFIDFRNICVKPSIYLLNGKKDNFLSHEKYMKLHSTLWYINSTVFVL